MPPVWSINRRHSTVTTSFPSTIARRTLLGTFALLLLVLSVFAGSAHAIPNNGNNGPGQGDPPIPPNPAPHARFSISPNPALVSELPVLTQARSARVVDVDIVGRNAVTFNASASTDDSEIVKYQWDLDGNGTFETNAGTAKTTKRSYSQGGSYTIKLKVTDDGGKTDIETHTLIVHKRPVARVAASAPVALIGDTVNYSAAGTTDDNGIAKIEWDLDGDGTFETNTGTALSASRSYGSIGERTVRMRVTDVYNASSTASVKVLIHRAPTAAFTAAPSPAFVGEQVTFDGSSSSDDENVAKYEWDLDGDGTFETNSAANPKTTKTYNAPGTITVRLKVTDNRGVSDVSTRPLTIQPKPPVETDRTAPKVRILTSTAKMSKKGIVAIKVTCPRTERLCSGRLALRQLGVRASKAALGGKALKLGGGQTATLRVKLSKAKQRLVRRNGSIRALATARVKDAAGNTGTATKRLKIRR
jgi:PKD repeat protein